MWKDKSGTAVGCEENRADRDMERGGLQKQLDGLFGLLPEIEAAIDQAGAVLSVTQPARMNGKYGLRWWGVKPTGRYREPVIVRWMLQGNGVMTPDWARVLKAKDHGTFAINVKETQACLDILSDLIKRRAEIKQRIFSISKSLRNLEGVSYYLNNEAERLNAIKCRAIENLIENGYDVEPSLLDEEADALQ